MAKSSDIPASPPLQEITSDRYNDLRYDALGHKYGADASKPSPTNDMTNHTYYATDTHKLYYCDGAQWHEQIEGVQSTWHYGTGKTFDTVYQNQTGRAILVLITASVDTAGHAVDAVIGATSSPSTQVCYGYYQGTTGRHYFNFAFVVPKDWYYKLRRASGTSQLLSLWHEMYLGEAV